MDAKVRAAKILKTLEERYPQARCSLRFGDAYQLWVATVLSAQCTDERVNRVTPALFRRCPGVAELAAVPLEELEGLVRPTGFYRNKAKSLKEGARLLLERFGGRLPETMEGLLQIPGVARKTANVVLGNAFGKAEGVVVDTHVRRLSVRMGLSAHGEPGAIERDLMALFPRDRWVALSHLLIHHGRAVCAARKPACDICPVRPLCPREGVA